MPDDLVEKLRRWAFKFCGKGEQENLASDAMSEAADRIEQLEKGFRDILKSNDDALIMSFIARACLHAFIDAQGRYCYVPFSVLEKKDD